MITILVFATFFQDQCYQLQCAYRQKKSQQLFYTVKCQRNGGPTIQGSEEILNLITGELK